MTPIDAATKLVKHLASQQIPPQAHSVWVQTLKSSHTDTGFKHSICVSINPRYKKAMDIPQTVLGFEVERKDWPKGM